MCERNWKGVRMSGAARGFFGQFCAGDTGASGWVWWAAAQPATAPAKATEAPIQEVVVTGSRIARADAETASR